MEVQAKPILSFMSPMPPISSMVVVGVGYTEEGFDQIMQLCGRDFFPGISNSDNKAIEDQAKVDNEAGDTSNFPSFYCKDLFPFVDSEYRTNPEDRTLWGYSAGGTFGTYALFKHPNTFQRYIINAPVLSWGEPDCFAFERQYAENHSDLSARLYLCAGELDELSSPLIEFHEILKSREYPGLNMELSTYKNETHLTGVMPSVSWGLRSVFG
jgi:predicted alpha/beta superfamily hydrolase